jgi:WhiB family redox-sensing transcriptional regulator
MVLPLARAPQGTTGTGGPATTGTRDGGGIGDAPARAGADRSRQNRSLLSSRFCQCPSGRTFRNVTYSNEAVPVRHSSIRLPLPEEPAVSTFSRPHLSLVSGWSDTAATPAASPWTDLSPVGDASWRLEALCAETDPEAFFPEKGGSTRDAKRVCSGCTVRAECLEFALANDERFGIWGGLSERERRRLRLQQRTHLSA